MKNFIFKLIFCLNISRHRFKNIRWIMSSLTLWRVFFLRIFSIVQTDNEVCVFSSRIFNIKFSFDTRNSRSKAIDMSCVRKNTFVIVVKLCDLFWFSASRFRRWLKKCLRTKNLNLCSMKFFDWFWWSNISSYFRLKCCKSDMILLLFSMIFNFSIILFQCSLNHFSINLIIFLTRSSFILKVIFISCKFLYARTFFKVRSFSCFFLYFFCQTTLLSMRCLSWNCSWWSVVKEWLTTTCWNIKNSSNLFNKFIDWIHWHIWMLNHECWREWHWIVQKWNKSNVRSV
jgi:hypothetical protein